jgi:ferredoxin
VVTRLGEGYLLEPLTGRGAELFAGGDRVREEHWQQKQALEQQALARINKHIDLNGLEDMLLDNLDHSIWRRTAEERCLSCANCVMVCPTCFCHDIRDRMDMGMDKAVRYRLWDACQDVWFAEVHGGNFRPGREARLRQFVLHKLDYSSQYGLPGTVGCGRCIEWCPTSIDLTEMAKEIRGKPDG